MSTKFASSSDPSFARVAEADEELVESFDGDRPLVGQSVHLIGCRQEPGIAGAIGRRCLDRPKQRADLLELDEGASPVVQVAVGVGAEVGERGLGLLELDEDPLTPDAQVRRRRDLASGPKQFLAGREELGTARPGRPGRRAGAATRALRRPRRAGSASLRRSCRAGRVLRPSRRRGSSSARHVPRSCDRCGPGTRAGLRAPVPRPRHVGDRVNERASVTT